jgi:hypothetical protein
MSKPPPYRIFRQKAGTPALVLQVRDPETGKAVRPCDLEGYTAVSEVLVPWRGVKIPAGSHLMLAPTSARFMLAAGTVATIQEPKLEISRKAGTQRQGCPTAPALDKARKATTSARPRNG